MVKLVHEIWAVGDESGFPLVTHTFYGVDEDEALRRYEEHARRDGNLQECFAGNPETARAVVTLDGRPRLCAIRWSFSSPRQEAPARIAPAELVLETAPPRRSFMPRLIRGGAGGGGGRRAAQMAMPIPEPAPMMQMPPSVSMGASIPSARAPEHMECDGDVCQVVPGKKRGGS